MVMRRYCNSCKVMKTCNTNPAESDFAVVSTNPPEWKRTCRRCFESQKRRATQPGAPMKAQSKPHDYEAQLAALKAETRDRSGPVTIHDAVPTLRAIDASACYTPAMEESIEPTRCGGCGERLEACTCEA